MAQYRGWTLGLLADFLCKINAYKEKKMTGKEIRLERIINRNTGKTVIVPMDHGVSSGPITGITNLKEAMSKVAYGGANAVIVHKGIVSQGHRKRGMDMGLIIHLSGDISRGDGPDAEALVCSVEEAIRLGADAVSVHVSIGSNRKDMLPILGNVAQTATAWGMPLIARISPQDHNAGEIKHAARVGAELGADIVSVPYTGDPDSFHEVVEGCHVPVIITGGHKMQSDRAILEMAHGAIRAGAAGVSIGRNVFQNEDPSGMVTTLAMIVHDGAEVEVTLGVLEANRETNRAGILYAVPC